MKLFVNVKTNAKTQKIEKINEYKLKVWVKAQPEKGRANAEMVEVLAKHFNISKSRVQILAGHTSASKIIAIDKA